MIYPIILVRDTHAYFSSFFFITFRVTEWVFPNTGVHILTPLFFDFSLYVEGVSACFRKFVYSLGREI
jgi:hypothetical protein